ncbi:hypothetical protein [Crateriforma conspicua]|uniref:Uncharacterized protein n=1 Tax=Crateriforma conspicua TaxID=2527996 RepID=A0A5C6FSQ6_9PLAN|nr:hypothetical protein [Crateriforma conspicua]TWU65326.1 hypothetical protein V7x_08720 [Crateriforma conspicua]
MCRILCIIAASLCLASSEAQEPAPADNPFNAETSVAASALGDKAIPGSVTFAFDGGTLRCTFGTRNRNATPNIAMIVFPSSVEVMTKRTGIPIKRRGKEAVVIVSTDERKFVQLTHTSVGTWSKKRIAEMSGRPTSVAENSFVSAVVHALSNDLPVSLWASDAQDALEAGTWCKLFDVNLASVTDDSFGDPFGGDPFK